MSPFTRSPRRRGRLPVCTLALGLALVATPSLRAADGDLDTAFNEGAFSIGWGADHVRATALEALADGGLLVGGTVGDSPGDIRGWVVSKRDAQGEVDLAWGLTFDEIDADAETMAITDDLFDMVVDASGRTWLAGSVNLGLENEAPMLARLAATGALDDSFDGNGILLLTDHPAEWTDFNTRAGVLLPDGRSVFVGTCKNCPTADKASIWVTRRLADGSPDEIFSGDGWVNFQFDDSGHSFPTAVALGENGRIVVAGGYTYEFLSTFKLVRLLSTGGFDGGFGGGDGIVSGGAYESAQDLAVDPSSGRIAIVDGSTEEPGGGVIRVYTSTGDEDTTWSGDGELALDLEEGTSLRSVAFQSDGKLLAVGTIDANGSNNGGFLLARTTKGGALDSSFDGNGLKRVEFDQGPNVLDRALVVETMGGRMVAAGYAGSYLALEERMAVVRLQNGLIFADGFERGSTASWAGY